MACRACVFDPMASMAAAVGPMNFTPASTQARAKLGVLGEESVTGMDRLSARTRGDVENLLDVEIGFGGCRSADGVGLIGLAYVQRGTIDIGVDGDRGNSHLVAGADDAHGDLAPVRDENLFEHEHRGRIGAASAAHGQTGYCTGRSGFAQCLVPRR